MINKLVKENPNAVIVDSGNLSSSGATDKLDITTSIMADLHYDALGIGDQDMNSANDFYKQTADKKLTVLNAAPSAPKSTVPYIIKNVDGVKVGIISFGGTGLRSGANDYQIRKALYTAYKCARQESDVLILLDQENLATKDWVERNTARFGAPDIVIGGAANTALQNEQVVGKTHIVPTFTQAKSVGVVDIEIVPGQDPKMTSRKIALDTNVPEDEEVAKRVKEVTKPQPVPSHPVVTNRPKSFSMSYYPPSLCKTCHIKHYEDWAKTKHASALKTLVDNDKNTPECLACHSEKYRRDRTISGPVDSNGGVECATCHFDSLPHGMERRALKVKTKVGPRMCLMCHTKDRSPAYDEKTYFPKVSHVGVTKTVTQTLAPPPSPPSE